MRDTGPELPTELIDHTLSFLHDDIKALQACSYTSRTFLRSARYHLFHTLTVGYEPDHDGTLGYVSFFRFLDRTPEVRPYIRSLKFVCDPAISGSGKQDDILSPVLSSCTLSSVLSYLPHLHTLILSGRIHIVASPCYQSVLLLADCSNRPRPRCHLPADANPPPLACLSLDSVHFTTRRSFTDVLQLFPAIDRLTVTGLHFPQDSPLQYRDGDNSCRVETGTPNRGLRGSPVEDGDRRGVRQLMLRAQETASFEVLVDILGQQLRSQSLEVISFEFDRHRQLKPFAALLSRSSESLESLALHVPAHPFGQISGEELRHLSLRSMKRLKTLTFVEGHRSDCDKHAADPFDDAASHTVCNSIKEVLLQVPTHIHEMHFHLKLRAFGVGSAGQLLDHFGWAELEEVAKRCEALRRVVFSLQGRPEGDQVLKGVIANRAPTLHMRGVLEVNFEK
ncbi:hypothetical protein EIP91_010375 [Steccherinum ochraceum]|uniref:F-box domain-containing protein n=1 Tax=Steccherinum ochraceum TaxID=92696 RepID=A0A4R0RLX4_9APHY|nr:hypothetical protein EIP91_010375 [Steccherinum ochraceum]